MFHDVVCVVFSLVSSMKYIKTDKLLIHVLVVPNVKTYMCVYCQLILKLILQT